MSQSSKTTPPGASYRPDIDGLRAVSVLAVLIYHAWPDYLPGGYVGVDIFFVISGFLISTIIFKETDQNKFSIRRFYSRRIRRIFPALLVILLFCLILGWFGLLADEYEQLGEHVASASVFLSNFTLIKESGYFDSDAELKPLLHLWSLGIEEQFYIGWPLVIFALAKFPKIRMPAILTFFSASLIANIGLIQQKGSWVFFHPLTRLWGLLAGAILAYFFLYHKQRALRLQLKYANYLSFFGLGLIIATFFVVNHNTAYPGAWAILPTAGAFLVIGSGMQAWINRHLLSLKWCVFIGLISYPLYLWHWPLLSFLRIFESSLPSKHLIAIAVVLSILFAWLTYRFIELQLRHNPSRWVIRGLVAGMICFGLMGMMIDYSKGLPERSAILMQKSKVFSSQLRRQVNTDKPCLDLLEKSDIDSPLTFCRTRYLRSKKWIAIIGDSHAHVAFPGFSFEFQKMGYGTILLANSGCPPFLGTVTGATIENKKSCQESINTIITYLKSEKRVEKVLIVTRGPVYITGEGFGVAEKSMHNFFIYSQNELDAHAVGDGIFFKGLETTILNLRDSQKELFYLLENPELGLSPRNCISKRPLTISNKQLKCYVEKYRYKTRMSSYRSGIFQLNSTVGGFTILDPEPYLCDQEHCYAIKDNHLLYCDDDHISVDGSLYLAAKLVPQMMSKGIN